MAPGSITTSMQYDIAGNQTSLADPSAGTIAYTYNGFGELTSQVNPGSVTTSISYLSDGRLDQKTTSEGVTYYRYNSNKQLANIKSPSNVSRSLGYDSKGRVTAVTDTIPGSNPFVTSITYDSKGRKSFVTHPSAVTETYGYNQNGYLSSVSAGGSVRWTTACINARGQLTTGTYGSNLNTTMGFDTYGFPTSVVTGTIQNYSFNFNPVTGNLAWRQNNKDTGLREDFQYDDLDRLTGVMKNSVTTLTMSYDGNTGGITGKSDAGTFTYDAFEKPYTIKSIDPSTGLVPDSTQTIGYTSFNKVGSIIENGYEADFIYGSDDLRSRMIVKQDGNTILTRWYPTGSYMKETSGGITKEYTFIGGDAYTAPVAAITQGGTTTYYNLLRDHLGSITHVVSSSGTVVAEYSFDAWGRMRNPATWVNYAPGSEPALMVAGRGFTGHEHLPWFNTINMNGRLYDPLVGMFLSPDNYVQSADNSQNFNRYSYCLNNPLKYIDPSGYLFSASGDRARMESYLRRHGYSQVEIWMMESDPFMGPTFDYEGSGGGGGGGMDYGTSFYETFVRPTQQPNYISGGKRGDQYGYWVREWVDSNGSVVYPGGLSGGGIFSEISLCERFIPITSQSYESNPSGGGGEDNRGTIISVANGAAAAGPIGIMADIGGVIDSEGNSRLYFTIGWAIGVGASGGLGYSRTSKNFNLNNFAGYSEGLLIQLPYLSVEGFADYSNGTDREYRGLNYTGAGVNVGVGAFYGGYHSYTFLCPVPPADFWCRPGRHF